MFKILFSNTDIVQSQEIVEIVADVDRSTNKICSLEIIETESWPEGINIPFNDGITEFDGFVLIYEKETTSINIHYFTAAPPTKIVYIDTRLLTDETGILIGFEFVKFTDDEEQEVFVAGIGDHTFNIN